VAPFENALVLCALFASSIAVAVVLGTDVFFTVVGRVGLARTSVPSMLETMGHLHEVADRRMPIFGVVGIAGSLVALLFAAGSRVATGTAVTAQLVWLAIYLARAKPVNAKMTNAVRTGIAPADARQWQSRWESVLIPRSLLMTVALLALLLAIRVSGVH
jgi:hypothetical protein